jgi:uncharacterized protein YceH (UPF0502 family)
MTTEAAPSQGPTAAPPSWPTLDARECRILGVLVEKAKTTPDAYPLSLNALLTGCNQKSNRDPATNYDEADVEETLAKLQKRGSATSIDLGGGYVQKIVGGRVERWRHVLYETWHVNKLELAVLAELLLRGPQTEGELRSRASRMEPIDDLDALRPVLRSLAERGLVVFLGEEGRRGTIIAHGFHSPAEIDRLRSGAPPARNDVGESPPTAAAPPAERRSVLETQVVELQAEVSALRSSLAEVQKQVTALAEQLRNLQQQLGG